MNQVRAQNGLPALQVDSQLTTLSRNWTVAQRDGVCGVDGDGNVKYICHASPISEGVTSNWRKLGENVGTGPSVSAVMDAFIASPSHYANIIDPEFTHIGVGVFWEGNRMYTTHRFMRLDAPAAATTTTAPPATTAAPTTAPATTAAPTTAAPTTAAPAPNPGQTSTGTETSDSDPLDANGSAGGDDSTIAEEDELAEDERPTSSQGQGQVNVDPTRASVLISVLELGF